jgi:hypothetical protein
MRCVEQSLTGGKPRAIVSGFKSSEARGNGNDQPGLCVYSLRLLGESVIADSRMNRTFILSLALAAAVSVAGCETPQQTNALGGAVIGGSGGALVGSALSHGSAGGAIAGGAIGAATGAMLGSASTPPGPYSGGPGPYYGAQGRCAQWAYDYNGNRVCTAFY